MKVQLLPTETEKAGRELRRLQVARGRLEGEMVADGFRLAELSGKLADANLAELLDDSGSAVLIRREITDLETKISGRASARGPLLERIRGALKDLAHARAESLRGEADKKQRALDAHLTKTKSLLSALHEHDGIEYAPKVGIPPVSQGNPILFMMAAGANSKGAALAREVAELRQQADAIEAAAERASAGGRIVAEDLSGLLKVCNDSESIGPTAEAVQAWHAAALARAEKQWAAKVAGWAQLGFTPPERQVVFEIVWNQEGVIDLEQSKATNRETHYPIDAHGHPSAYRNVA